MFKRDLAHTNSKLNPWLVGFFAGVYPMLFYAGNNYSLVNSWGHFWFFIGFFLILPMLVAKVTGELIQRFFGVQCRSFWLAFVGIGWFFYCLKVTLLEAPHRKITLSIILIALVYAYFLKKYHRKIMILQGIVAFLALVPLGGQIYGNLTLSEDWKKLPDQIDQVALLQKPNIYLLQPDGLVNFSELSRGHYKYQDSSFMQYLNDKGFTHYDDFRSNYASTLSSNSALLMMKHHYYNNGNSFSEALDARESIVSENHVLNVLSNNGYQTHLISVAPYLTDNLPKLGFDTANFSPKEIGYLSQGFNKRASVVDDLRARLDLWRNGDPKNSLGQMTDHPQFYFIEFFNPGHIHGRKEMSLGVAGERDLWLESMECGQQTTKALIELITQRDPGALILILADHGGFVGFEYTNQIYTKTQDRDLIYSIFSSQLSIKWPDDLVPKESIEFTTSVNVFRLLFAHLSQNQSLKDFLEPDNSFVILKDNGFKGIYQYIDAQGQIDCKKIEP